MGNAISKEEQTGKPKKEKKTKKPAPQIEMNGAAAEPTNDAPPDVVDVDGKYLIVTADDAFTTLTVVESGFDSVADAKVWIQTEGEGNVAYTIIRKAQTFKPAPVAVRKLTKA